MFFPEKTGVLWVNTVMLRRREGAKDGELAEIYDGREQQSHPENHRQIFAIRPGPGRAERVRFDVFGEKRVVCRVAGVVELTKLCSWFPDNFQTVISPPGSIGDFQR